jgi:hypothetical protein
VHMVRIGSLSALLQFCEASREIFRHEKCAVINGTELRSQCCSIRAKTAGRNQK